MPIRFACPQCRQKLSISSRKAGTLADCPRCKTAIQIPQPTEPAPSQRERLPRPVQRPMERPPTKPIAQLADLEAASPPITWIEPDQSAAAAEAVASPAIVQIADEPAPIETTFEADDGGALELVYDTGDPPAVEHASEPVDVIAVPRWIIYLQGGLLAVVALASFAIGLIAGSTFDSGERGPREPVACTLEGTINYAAGNRNLADAGAVVAVIPQNQLRPDDKAPAVGLRPEDTLPGANDRGVSVLRELGGAYARTDNRGRFQVKLPDRGKYLILVISNSRQLKSLDEISTKDLVELQPFFDNAADLLGRQRYQLTQEVVRGDWRLDVVFE
jgi:hypothetical protein